MRGVHTGYTLAYRLGLTPWERYGETAEAAFGVLLDREEAERTRPLGRALDLGCGRGQKSRELARRGWEVVGVDNVPRALDAATGMGTPDITYVVGDVTDLDPTELGTFDFFLDVGCFQHPDVGQRRATGREVSALANPGATLLMLEFQATRIRSLVGGVTGAELEFAFAGWEMLSVQPAETTGLGWPLTRMAPQWYRLRRSS